MKRGYARDYPGSKLYFTEADASSQCYYSINFDHFDVKLKLWLLLCDHVILSSGHMLESPVTFRWLTSSPDVGQLAEDLVLLPSLREDRDSFEAFVLESPESEGKPSLLRSQRDCLLQRAKELDDIFKASITWSPSAESNWFRDSFVRDLTTENSPLRKRLVGIRTSAITSLADEMASCEFLTREKLQHLIATHCPQRQTILSKYGDLYYYISGALFKDSAPLLHPQAAILCREKVSYEMSFGRQWQQVEEYWRTFLDLWQVSSLAISRLTLKDIICIRKDSIGLRVRKTWTKLTDEARQAASSLDTLEAFQKSRDELLNSLRREMSRQQERRALIKKARSRIEVASWVTTGIGTLAGFFALPSFALAALGIVGLLVNKPLMDAVEKRIPSTELVLLSSRIRG